MSMFAEERQRLVANRVAEAGRVSVTELADRFSVTTETVRRDLAALETAGVLRRVHGGAVPAGRGATSEESLLERQVQNLLEKRAIADAAAALVASSRAGSVLLDAGSSTEALAERLMGPLPDGQGLVVVTNALPIAEKLAANPNLNVQLLGGRIRPLTQAAVGQATVDAVGRLRPDLAFVGANGLHAEFGLSTPDTEEAAVKAAFVRSARRVVALVDHTKFGVEALVQFARLDQLDAIVTDVAPTGDMADALAEAGVEVVEAGRP
ncbi:D-beta-D-heptose 1-phosphate adenosyltransferase [Sinomonas cyclohexanicum]|uniref:Lactose phosphotransferase system repressor n=2 Tax=Sinomonas cyclohexanicum TaxID=322009 RepID=A0ABN6FCT8_SINCY|nr:DeoR/GlpR family DNA-binding transcription regulator [Corynebacterium cyclohexanicum]BCT74523.1 D-beta-D-heptose 1-phosphate adenosyltransferase [Corynebacterium cyclohexanicum]